MLELIHCRSTVSRNYDTHQQATFDIVVSTIVGVEKKIEVVLFRNEGEERERRGQALSENRSPREVQEDEELLVPAHLVQTLSDDKELWQAVWSKNFTEQPMDLRFSLRCITEGRVTWEDSIHSLKANQGSWLKEGFNVFNHMHSSKAYFSTTRREYNGRLLLRNISSHKSCKVVYTTNRWKTIKESWATYAGRFCHVGYEQGVPNPNELGLEEWLFQLELNEEEGEGLRELIYAICYMVNGECHWDNNFGNNYVTELVRERGSFCGSSTRGN